MAICRDSEDWNAVSRLRVFDISPCFEEGVIISSLLSVVFILTFLRTVTIYFSQPLERSHKSIQLLCIKLVLLGAALIVSIANVLFTISHPNNPVPVLYSYLLEPFALTSILIFTYFNHTRSRSSSTILLIFWPLYIAAIAAWIRTLMSKDLDCFLVILSLKCATLGLAAVAFGFECKGPEFETNFDSPILTANVYSIWSFSWMSPLVKKGAIQIITEDDLPPLKPTDESHNLGEDLKQALKNRPLWRALFVAYGGPFAIAAGLKVIQDILAFLQPQLLRWLLSYISRYQDTRFQSDERPSELQGFAIAIVMFIVSVTQTICLNQYFQRAFETGMRARAGVVTVIYGKSLVLANNEHSRASGDIVNLMSVDATRLQEFCTYGLMAISGPLQITLAFISLYNLLGWAAFVGVAIMIIAIPINTYIARMLKAMYEEQMKNRDKRTRLMSDLLSNIKSIKFYAWEYSFIRRILSVRNEQELKMLRKIGIVQSCHMAFWSGIPLVVAFSSFATVAIISSRPLTSDLIFPAISLFMLLQFPLEMVSLVTSNIIEAVVSIKRLSSFLNSEELEMYRTVVDTPRLQLGDEVLSIKDADFSWSKDGVETTLEGINLSVKKGELLGLLGRVGAGKSSLLSAILGDMHREEGEVVLHGSIAYVHQQPWILSATVRDNILFSHEYDEVFYSLVIEGCALGPDLALLPQGDMTEVGEKGITLSGGQRARISLARAVYARADLILLDDCLAAVDSHVARHIFDNVIGPNGLLSTKARILVTNSISFVKQFDSLAFIRRGILLEHGSYQALATNPTTELYKLIQGHGSNANSSGSSSSLTPGGGTLTPVSGDDKDAEFSDTVIEKSQRKGSFQKARIFGASSSDVRSTGLEKEHQEQGSVKMDVYMQYIYAASKIGFVLYLIATATQQASLVLASLTLRYWGEHNQQLGNNSGMFQYLLVYGLFSFSSSVLGATSAIILWVYCTVRSAKQLHDSMLDSLMHAPLSFFELTPTGRILNLFSRDTYVVDQILPRVIESLCRTFAVSLSIIVVIGCSFPPFLVIVLPLGWLYLRIMRYYLATSRELKRLDAVTRSPIFAWFSESLAGLSTIRAFGQQSIFTAANQKRIDRNQICYLPSVSVNRWLSIRLELLGAIIILTVAFLAISALVTTGVDAGLVGLVLSYALNTTSSLNWAVRSASEVEQNIVSVERILHQTQVEPEAPHEISDTRPGGLWPSQGAVEFRNYSTRYKSGLDLVLKEISLSIKPKEKIGVCGRTGAGKSSLLVALFRIIEPVNGTIYIDFVDITTIGLHDLRSAISIVPQSPDLFEGTLRENIDPVGEHSDVDIWVALDQAHLKVFVETLPGKLDTRVHEGGSSLSAGQRQLLCFARALLRKSKILVLDEATSAVDLDTDRAIQDIMSGSEFSDVTVITIAHRLNTILKSDRIIVMDSGKVAEFDNPPNLLKDHSSIFYSLVQEAGLIN